MNPKVAIFGIFALGYLVGASTLLPVSIAGDFSKNPPGNFLNMTAQTTVTAQSTTVTVPVKAYFEPAASFKIEHELMKMADVASQIDISHAVTRMAYLTIGNGVKGEATYMTCGVSSTHEGQTHTRDCSGDAPVSQHEIMAGHKMDNGIMLTNDLMPNPTGKSDSTVSIDVSFL